MVRIEKLIAETEERKGTRDDSDMSRRAPAATVVLRRISSVLVLDKMGKLATGGMGENELPNTPPTF